MEGGREGGIEGGVEGGMEGACVRTLITCCSADHCHMISMTPGSHGYFSYQTSLPKLLCCEF